MSVKYAEQYGLETLDKAAALVARFEGFSADAYLCPAGVLTIGYGHTHNVKEGMTITKERAMTLLSLDLFERKKAIEQLVRVPVTEGQVIALLSFVFNVGVGNFEKSTLLKKLNAGNYEGASREFSKWIYANRRPLKGLMDRRKIEREYFDGECEDGSVES